MVAVTGQDHAGAFGRGDDFPLDPPGPFQPGARAAQPSGRRVQQFRGADGGEVFHAGAGVAAGVAAAGSPA